VFELVYSQHGGSGLQFTCEDVMNLPLDRMQWFYDELSNRRSAEADAIRQASNRRK